MVFTLRPFGHTFALWQRALALVQSFVLLYRPLRLGRCRKNLPLCAPSMLETFDNSRVLWRETEVGHIERVGYDFPHFYGRFVPSEHIEQFRELFTFLMDEDATGDPPFAADLLDDENWWIVRPSGDRIGTVSYTHLTLPTKA